MRAVLVFVLAVGCAKTVPYKLTVPTEGGAYEVGEDVTVVLDVKKVSDDDAKIIITRPDGTIVKENASLDAPNSRIRFGRPPPHPGLPPTITIKGTYTIELQIDDKPVSTMTVDVTSDRINALLPMEDVADYKQITRYTRPKIYGKTYQGKSYGAIYSPPWRVEARVEITIDEPKKHLKETWKLYAEEGAPSVIENNNVIFRERSESVTASWYSDGVVVRMQAPTLDDLEKGIIGHFLKKFPSKLESK
jgi:hypothetical protein